MCIRDSCSSYPNANFTFVEQKERLGLGHAIYQGLDAIDEPLLIVLGDSIFELDYNRFLLSNNSTIGVATVPDPKRFGIVELAGNRISNVWEKPDNPPSNLALIGIYYISSQLELSMGIEHLIKHEIRTKNAVSYTHLTLPTKRIV